MSAWWLLLALPLCVLAALALGGPPPSRWSWRHKNPPWLRGCHLLWELHEDTSQRTAYDAATGYRFVITHCTDPEGDGLTWEVEQSTRRGSIALDYFPTLTDALHECELRVSARRATTRPGEHPPVPAGLPHRKGPERS